MTTKSFNLILILFISFSSGCSTFEFEGDVTAEVIPPQIHLHNQTNRTIYFFAADQDDLAHTYVDLSNFSDWPKISPGEVSIIQYDELAFYDEGDTRAWIHWTTKEGDYGSFGASL